MYIVKKFEKYSIRSEYEKSSPEEYYKTKSNDYENPHKDRVIKCLDFLINKIEIGTFLDLAAGDGVVSEYLNKRGFLDFKAYDPYFYEILTSKFGGENVEKISFQDIAKDGIIDNFDTIICSYALHLCDKSYLHNLIWNISNSCKYFVTISPSKYPILDYSFLKIIENEVIERTHIKIYKSIF